MDLLRKNKAILKFISVSLASVMTISPVVYGTELSLPDNIITAFAYNTGNYKVNTTSGLRLRSEPNTSSTIFCGIPDGTQIYVEQINGDWGYVRDVGGWNHDTWVV
ncbi:MAG: SH3 domain-containing protein, partial [Ruminococcus sp.]|nr:SH3 domain-containing protein [Ruminococcus sp.]